MATSASPSGPDGERPGPRRYLVVGDTELAVRVCRVLEDAGHALAHLRRPSDDELRTELGYGVSGVAVLMRDDVSVLRYTLAVSHVDTEVAIVASIFDRTIGGELTRLLPHVVVTSPAALSAPILADQVTRAVATPRRRLRLPVLRRSPWRALDPGSRMLFAGATGLATVLLVDFVWLVLSHGGDALLSLREAALVVATVGPGDVNAGRFYVVFSAVAMLATLALTAMFTAGLVEGLVRQRLATVFGRRSIPRRDHVVVIGFGQIGYRLCLELQARGVPAVAVERDAHAKNLRLARGAHLPVVIGHGDDRELLQALRIDRALAVAGVGADDLDNVAVAVAAHAVAPDVHVVLRAGEQEAVAETRSLLPLGETHDVHALTTSYVCATLLGSAPVRLVVVPHLGIDAVGSDGSLTRYASPARRECSHRVS